MMKRTFLGGLLATIGLARPASADDSVTMIDPRTILFSMPTISDDAPPVLPFAGSPTNSDVAMHEDEWRQLEFFPNGRLPEIQDTLGALKSFEAAHRVQSGWTQIYVRRLASGRVASGSGAVNALATAVGASVSPGLIIFHGSNAIHGRVQNGFTLNLGPGAVLYGFADTTGVPVLGAYLQNADDMLLTTAFAALNRSHGLVLVDWRAQMIATSVEANGQISVWRP